MKKFALALLVLLAPSAVGSAALISRDWKTPGDGLLTFDTVNKREWLDLPYVMEQFPLPGRQRDLERRYQEVLAATMAGGSLDGFTIAARSDVVGLALSAGIDASTSDITTNALAAIALLDLVGRTSPISIYANSSATGLLDDFATTPSGTYRLVGSVNCIPIGYPEAGFRSGPVLALYSDDSPGRFTSVWLYRQVPEPPALIVVTGTAIMLAAGKVILQRTAR